MAKLWQFFQGHPKPAFSEKVQWVDQGKFFKNRPKSSTLAEMVLSSKYYAFKLQRLDNIVAQKAAPKVPEWPSYGNFCKITQNPHFLKNCSGGTTGKFSNVTQKVALV